MRASIAAMAVIVGLVGCGGDDDDASTTVSAAGPPSSAGSSLPSSSGTPVTSVDGAADSEAAATALLRLEDFPAGWSEVPLEDRSDTDQEAAQQVAMCAGVDAPSLIDFGGAVARTGTFTSPTDDQVTDTVGVASSVDAATARTAAVAGGDFGPCIRDVYQSWMEDVVAVADPGTTVGVVTVARLNVTPAGDETLGYRTTIPLESNGTAVGEVYADQVVVRVGRGLSGLAFQTQFAPYPTDHAEHYIALAAERLAAAGF